MKNQQAVVKQASRPTPAFTKWFSLTLASSISLGVVLFSPAYQLSPSARQEAIPVPSQVQIRYQSYTQAQNVVHTLLIPASSRFLTSPVVSDSLEKVEVLAQKHQASAAINGGFFDPVNQKTTSIVMRNGLIVADPRLNERLIQNPKNAPYLNQMLNRSELRRYDCGQTVRYDITLRHEPTPAGCRLVDALGGGPRLLPDNGLTQEGFADVVNGKVIRDALGSSLPNARTAIGITADSSLLWVMVAQKPENPTNSGMSLPQLAEFMKSIGVEKAINLDGGSSSSFDYRGQIFYGKVDAKGHWVKRPVKSALLIQEN